MTRGFQSIFKLAVLLLVLAVVAFLWTRSRSGETSAQDQTKPKFEGSAPAIEATQQDKDPQAAAPVREVAEATAPIPPATPLPTLGEYLKNYWGDRWPEMEAKYAEWCFMMTGKKDNCLAQPLDAIPPPWESVVANVQATLLKDGPNSPVGGANGLGWPAEGMTDEALRNRYKVANGLSVGPAELAAIEGIGHKYNAEIEARCESSKQGMLKAVNMLWLAGKFERAPVALPFYTGTDAWWNITLTQDHWCVRVELKHGDYPWLEEGSASLNALKQTRDDEVQSYLNSLP